MLETSFGLIFYLKKRNKQDLLKERYLYFRVTIDGVARDISAKRFWHLSLWNRELGRAMGGSEAARSINSLIDTLTVKVHQARKLLLDDNKPVTAEGIKDILLGRKRKQLGIIDIFKEHNRRVEALVGLDYALGTLNRYQTTLDHTKSYIRWKYQVDDLGIGELNYEFVSDFEFWLKTERKCGHNTAIKYIANFKKIVLICVKRGLLPRDPFYAFRLGKVEVHRLAMTDHELSSFVRTNLSTERLSQVRDVFLFCCYTGLAYADVRKLKQSDITEGIDGGLWIKIKRQKTEVLSRIPLLPQALSILNKYADWRSKQSDDQSFPVLSNQKMNIHLKEIAAMCGIRKNVTCHLARHTFATTVTLTNGVPLETVSKMLGHKNIQTTQLYAKTVDKKIAQDMADLVSALKRKNPDLGVPA